MLRSLLQDFKAKDKLRLKKYNPATQKHEWFVEKKLPPHSK
jgi:large subunit ribosomal protein L33